MLVFNSFKDLNLKANQLNLISDAELKKFESTMGVKTPAGLFREVIHAEDSISNYYFSLPDAQQSYWRIQPEKHSGIFKSALSSGLLKMVKDVDGSEYFDLNLSQNSYATILNAEGFVKVDTIILQYTSDAIKVIKNGDFQLVDKLKTVNEDYEDGWIIVKKRLAENRLKHAMSNNWTIGNTNAAWVPTEYNWLGVLVKRVRVWIDGHSEPYGSYSPGCAEYVSCTHVVRAEAMKKNFWGTWIYGDYVPSFSFNSTWSYKYVNYSCDPYITSGCGVYSCEHLNDVGSDSPYSFSWPTVNNAYVNLLPTGIWSGTFWFHSPFWTYGDLTSTFAGHSFNYSW